MFKYTASALKSTLDFVKSLIYVLQVVIQLIYGAYIVYRIINQIGHNIINIILFAVTFFYILFFIISKKEFYTKKQILQRNYVKWISKAVKYALNGILIALSAKMLVQDTTQSTNVLMLIVMISTFMFSLMFDMLLIFIESQIKAVENAFLYDVGQIKENHKILAIALKNLKFDLNKEFASLTDESKIKKVKDIYHKQMLKKERKEDFENLNDY